MIAYSSWILVWLIQSDWTTESIHLSCASKSLFVLVQTTDTPQNTYCAEAWIIALLCPAQALILVAWSLSIFEIAPWTSCVHADLSGPWICWSHWANAQSPARTLKVRFCTKDIFMNLLQCKTHHWLALHLKHGYLFCHGTSFTHLKHQDHKWKKETHEAVRQSWILGQRSAVLLNVSQESTEAQYDLPLDLHREGQSLWLGMKTLQLKASLLKLMLRPCRCLRNH